LKEDALKRILFVSLCLCVAALPIRGDAPKSQKSAIAYLQKLQQKDGGFAPSVDQPKSSLRATNGAVKGLNHFDGEIPDKAACADFVKSCFDKESGGFADQPGGQPNVEVTAVGVMVVAELKLSAEPFETAAAKYLGENVKTFEDIRIAAAAFEAMGKRPAQADAWLKQIAKLRNEDGTYGMGGGVARDTGGAVAAVIRLGGKIDHPDAAIKSMKSGQRADGGFGMADSPLSDLPTSYRVMRSLHMLQSEPEDVGRLRAFLDSCHNTDGGYGVAKGKPSSASGTYYVSSILQWLDEK
jgi:prenyltransferase beta subunit